VKIPSGESVLQARALGYVRRNGVMKKKRKTREPDELDRRILAKLQPLGGPLPPEELDRRLLAKIAELEARIAGKAAEEQ
jgi:hypothetical protein